MAGPWDDFQSAATAPSAGPWADYAARPPPASKPAAAPKATPPKRSAVDQVTGLMSNFNRGSGIGDEIAAFADSRINMGRALMTGKQHLDPADPMGSLKQFGDVAYQDSLRRQRGSEDTYTAEHPNAAALARGTGMAATAVAPGGRAIAAAPRMVNMARGAGSAALAAGTYALADRGTVGERLTAAGSAMTNPVVLALGAAGGALSPTKARMTKPVSEDVAALRERGVQLTPGQARGGLAKGMEDAATSLPILGPAIQDARRAGVESFNTAVANEALAPLGEKVPASVPAGHQLVKYVEDTIGKGYESVIPKGGVIADSEMKSNIATRLGDIAQEMTPAGRARLFDILDNRVTSRFQKGAAPGNTIPAVPGSDAGLAERVDGSLFQRIQSELGTVKGRFSSSQDADQRAIAEGIDVIREEMRNAAARQNPEFAAQKAALDKGWAEFKRLQGAAAAQGSEAGVFTPAQYGASTRRADKSVDKGATARGGALGQDLADTAKSVLPSKVPDSGTGGRLMTGALVTAPSTIAAGFATGGVPGGLAAAGGIAATLGILKGGAKAYSPKAIELANQALDARISQQGQRAALEELRRLGGEGPKLQQLYQDVAARTARTAAVVSDRQVSSARQ